MGNILIEQTSDALIVIDIQNDFCPSGALGVTDGDTIVPLVNSLMTTFEHVVLTQDWHPANHTSFASSQEGAVPYDSIEVDYGPQTLWPDHCIQGTRGASFHSKLTTDRAELVIRKGYHSHIDSYSAFYENDQMTPTGLSGYLHERGIKRLFLTGLATDFCVAFSAIDARKEGFETFVIEDACRAINLEGSLTKAWKKMNKIGVKGIQSPIITQ